MAVTGLRARLRTQFAHWAARRQGSTHPPLVLNHRQIYILPTGAGIGFGVLLLVIWVGSLNYSLNLGYLLGFWLAGTALLSMLQCFRNQSGLQIGYGAVQPVFAGQLAQFPLQLRNPDRQARPGIELEWPDMPRQIADISPAGTTDVCLTQPAHRRGWLRPGRLTLANRQPLGLFRAWSYIHLDWACLVYPQPEAAAPSLPEAPDQLSDSGQQAAGQDDFFALREHRPGDSPRHVAWRQAARDDILRTKQYAGGSRRRVWLDYAALPSSLQREARLARLTAWVLAAAADDVDWGLRLPGQELPLQRGDAHRDACLRLLALFGSDEAAA